MINSKPIQFRAFSDQLISKFFIFQWANGYRPTTGDSYSNYNKV